MIECAFDRRADHNTKESIWRGLLKHEVQFTMPRYLLSMCCRSDPLLPLGSPMQSVGWQDERYVFKLRDLSSSKRKVTHSLAVQLTLPCATVTCSLVATVILQ